jgi:hypothetical protein
MDGWSPFPAPGIRFSFARAIRRFGRSWGGSWGGSWAGRVRERSEADESAAAPRPDGSQATGRSCTGGGGAVDSRIVSLVASSTWSASIRWSCS